MGMNVHVYRWSLGDCTMNGISAPGRGDGLCLVNVEGPFQPNDRHPAAMLVEHTCFGEGRGLVRIVPAVRNDDGEWEPEKRWLMFGGNYAGGSDSRFNAAVEAITGFPNNGPVAIHDRIEG